MKTYKGKFNWYGEIHEFNGDVLREDLAYNKFTRVLSKKLGHRSHIRVRSYFDGSRANYEIKEVRDGRV